MISFRTRLGVFALAAGLPLAALRAQAPLSITTVPPLFDGVVGAPYAQTFSAAGGTQPYSWAITSGSAGDLTLGAASGTLEGLPQAAGVFSFVVQVTDSAGNKAAASFSVVIKTPQLNIITSSALPGGTVGVAYSQRFAATGGTPPYAWSLASGSVPGLSLDASSGTLSGSPAAAGAYNFTLQVRDSGGLSSVRAFTLAVAPGALTITTVRQLPDATVGAPFSRQVAASGGSPPYAWSANGLPAGLSIDAATGLISGSPAAAGSFPNVVITVADSALKTYQDLFQIMVKLPALPSATITGLPAAVSPAQQIQLQVSIASPFPAPITGQAILTFVPDQGGGDGSIQFAAGGLTADFTIPAGSTIAAAATPLAIQTGTVAGAIGISLRLQAGGADITPSPAPAVTARVERAAPTITRARTIRAGNTISVEILGFSTAREVTQAVFTFSATGGQTLQPSASSITLAVDSLFGPWFQDSSHTPYGSQFLFTQPFTIQGDANAVAPVSVTLTNRVGSATANVSAQ